METTLEVPFGEEPPSPIFAPVLPPAGILLGDEPIRSLKVPVRMIVPGVPNLAERLRKIKPEETAKVKLESKVEFGPLFRVLAKIAHGFCVVRCGLEGFEHILPKYILGTDDRLMYVVGGPASPLNWKPVGGHHVEVHVRNVNGKWYLTAMIQLLVKLDFPVYEVVAGEMSPASARATLAQAAALARAAPPTQT
jgi:hypothetical protein